MAKNSITDYSKTASLNTDIQSVDIDEGCLPSGINNAIRELMADLAAVNDGTVALTSPAFTSVDINSGTIDGVTIGGASAAAGTFTTFTSTGIDDNASSTAVTIDSSGNVGIGTGLPQTLLEIASGNSGNDAALDSPTFRINNTTESADWDIGDAIGTIEYYSSDSSGNSPYVTSFIKSVNDTGDGTLPSGALTFGTATYNEVGGAVERLRIDSSGNVLVGKTSTSSALTTVGVDLRPEGRSFMTRSAGPSLYLSRTTSDGNIAEFYKDGTTVGSIGTAGSDATIGTGDTGLRFRDEFDAIQPHNTTTNVTDDGVISLGKTGASFKDLYLSNSAYVKNIGGISDTDTYLNFGDVANTIKAFTGGSERMRIDSSGNVGIGTSSFGWATSGRGLVEINGSSSALYGAKVGNVRIGYLAATASVLELAAVVNVPLTFLTNNSERMRIDSSGNVLVGKTTSSIGTAGVELKTNGSTFTRSAGSPVFINRTTSDGAVIDFRKDNTTVGSISVTGSSTAYNTSSDYRLKENVTGITDGIERVKQLNPSRFNFIADADRTVDGFLAHEAATVVPEAVAGEKDAMRDEEYEVTPAVFDDDGNVVTEAVMGTRSVPDYQGIDQAKLVPLLTAALQEAITKIEDLEARVATLETN